MHDRPLISDTWERGDPYERYVGRWSRRIAPVFLDWMAVPHGQRWLDLGCGTGALTAAVLDHAAPASVTGVDPSPGFLDTARTNLGGRVTLLQGSATAIPLAAGAVDVLVSALMLNFVADPLPALAEMARVVGPGGTIGAYVWDYQEGMVPIRAFWDAAVACDPAAASLDEGLRFPICRANALDDLFEQAGMTGIDVTAIDIATPFRSFDDYWQPFLGGQGPAPAYAMALDAASRDRLREHIRARLPAQPDGSIALTARAWAVRAIVAP